MTEKKLFTFSVSTNRHEAKNNLLVRNGTIYELNDLCL